MIEQWYEVRVDGEKVAAFAPSETQGSLEESLRQARNVVETTRDDLYKNKALQIVERESWGGCDCCPAVIYETGLVKEVE